MIWRADTLTELGKRVRPNARQGLSMYFLERLARLEDMRRAPMGAFDRRQRRLVEHALYSTYWDCVHLGLREEAQELLGISEPVEA